MTWKNDPVTRPRREPAGASGAPYTSRTKAKGSSTPARDDGRIVELVAAQDRASAPKRAIRRDASLAIAERHAALCKTGFDAEQARHRMGDAGRIGQALAHRHIAPAFAVRRARLGEAPETFAKSRCRRQPPGVQFRIAARKPADIAIGRRRLVGEGREWDDLGAGRPPALHEMRVDERESGVARERDPLSRRPNRDGRRRGRSEDRDRRPMRGLDRNRHASR